MTNQDRDIVARLQNLAFRSNWRDAPTLKQAADEIARLRREVAALQDKLMGEAFYETEFKLQCEYTDKLRAEVAAMQGVVDDAWGFEDFLGHDDVSVHSWARRLERSIGALSSLREGKS